MGIPMQLGYYNIVKGMKYFLYIHTNPLTRLHTYTQCIQVSKKFFLAQAKDSVN